MGIRQSPEIESLMRRVWVAWHERDMSTISNLFADEPSLVGIGSDSDEWWMGSDEFLRVRHTQFAEMPEYEITVNDVVAFEDGEVGWAAILLTMSTPVMTSKLRTTAVFRLENGAWRIVQWHNSLPVPNEQMFGVELTTSLDQLLASVAEEQPRILSTDGFEGTATLMFTDIVDSTILAERMGDLAWSRLAASHEETLRTVAGAHEGRLVKMLGDGAMLAFDSARAAVRAAVGLQHSLTGEGVEGRIGIHTGEVVHTTDDLLGVTVNKAARVAAAAGAGEILISSTVRDLIGTMPDMNLGQPRVVALKGLRDTHQLIPIRPRS